MKSLHATISIIAHSSINNRTIILLSVLTTTTLLSITAIDKYSYDDNDKGNDNNVTVR